MSVQPLLITDAAPSFDEQQAHRRRTYSILMVVHIVGFALSYPLYLWQPWVGVVAIALTGVLPWVAVLLANDPPATPSESRRARDVLPAPVRTWTSWTGRCDTSVCGAAKSTTRCACRTVP